MHSVACPLYNVDSRILKTRVELLISCVLPLFFPLLKIGIFVEFSFNLLLIDFYYFSCLFIFEHRRRSVKSLIVVLFLIDIF